MNNPAFGFVQQLGRELAAGEFELPPFPDTAMRVQECINDPNSDIQQLGAVVASEPALAARLIRMANSAMMRRGPIEVADIGTAISRVGMDMVQNAAVSFAAREAFKAPPGSPCLSDLNSLRRHSVKVASLGYILAKESRYLGKPDIAMLTGLLHAVGKYYIFMKASEHPDLFTDRPSLEQLVAQWHTGVARAIVESWQFPADIAIAVDEQELKERDRLGAAELSDILYIANLIARIGNSVAKEIGDLDAMARLRLDGETLYNTLEENQDEIRSMVEALSG
ncbi:MAG: HDOD domain-containing protein [Pseudomonadota bacterium]